MCVLWIIAFHKMRTFFLHPRSLLFTSSLSLSFTLPAVWASQLWDGTDISPQGAARADHLHAYCTSVVEEPCAKTENNTERQTLAKPLQEKVKHLFNKVGIIYVDKVKTLKDDEFE